MTTEDTVTPRDRFNQVMSFSCPGKTLATLGGIWPSTFERWHREGLPAEVDSIPGLLEMFGLQPHIWSTPKAELFTWPHFDRKIIRETAETVTYVNPFGIICTDLKKDAYKSMPHFEEFPIKSRQDWDAYKHRLRFDSGRVGDDWTKQARALRDRKEPLILSLSKMGSLYGSLRELFGVEALSFLFYDDPDLVSEIMDSVLELFLKMTDVLFRDFTPDTVCLWEDMAYVNGSLLSIRHVREFMTPRYKVMTGRLRELGVPLIFLDSDGDISELIPVWLECGIDGVVPMEVQSGMNVKKFRERYPELRMCGGVDKKALAAGKNAIDRNMNDVAATIAKGGLIPWFDHGLPHDVSYENFVYFVEQLKKVAG